MKIHLSGRFNIYIFGSLYHLSLMLKIETRVQAFLI